jgi:hypothetical protein
MLPMPSSTSMDMIGRCTTSVGEDHRTITRQVDFIPHWSKGNFGELCGMTAIGCNSILEQFHRGSVAPYIGVEN